MLSHKISFISLEIENLFDIEIYMIAIKKTTLTIKLPSGPKSPPVKILCALFSNTNKRGLIFTPLTGNE